MVLHWGQSFLAPCNQQTRQCESAIRRGGQHTSTLPSAWDAGESRDSRATPGQTQHSFQEMEAVPVRSHCPSQGAPLPS